MARKIQVGVTGSHGFLGWHLRIFLRTVCDVEVVADDRHTLSDPDQLATFVRKCDAIIHLAGMNRGEGEEVYHTNLRLTEGLTRACQLTGSRPHIIFASSTHVFRDSAYGRAKRLCAEALSKWAAESGGGFTNLILPNVFGEGGRPFYNSVVATFSHQLALGEEPIVYEDRQLDLVHAQDVAEQILERIRTMARGEIVVCGEGISVLQLLAKLKKFSLQYEQNIIPALSSKLDLQLFNTLRWYFFPRKYPVRVEVHQDERGDLFEGVKSLREGQIFLSTTRSGVTRGNHFHRRKIERFMVLAGSAELKTRKVFDSETNSFFLKGQDRQFVDIPTMHTHAITNTGEADLLTLFWSSEVFDPENPDTYAEAV